MENREIVRLKVAESTNSYALALAKKGAAPGTVVVAESQTEGRGRLNRSWLSPPGMGLYFSLLLRPELVAGDLPKITLASGLAICRVIESEYNLTVQIKWPNDLLLSGRKFAGILAETGPIQHISTGRKPYVVIGVGLNLYPPVGGFPSELKERATALSQHTGKKIVADQLLPSCIHAIEEGADQLKKGNFHAILKEWKLRDVTREKTLAWVTPQGTIVRGVALGPDADGLLQIRDMAGAVYQVISGDIDLINKERE